MGTSAHAQARNIPSEYELQYFYRQPSAASAGSILAGFNASELVDKPAIHPPMIGFLAVVFQKYPNDIEKLIPADSKPRMLATIAIALRLAGDKAKADTVAERLGRTSGLKLNLEPIPASLDQLKADSPTDFDVLWGASFASGDPRYCRKILDRYASVANLDGNAEDMVAIVKAMGAKTDMRWIVEKHGQSKARDLIFVSTGLWALAANARQHGFVRAEVEAYIKNHAGDPAAKALQSVR